MQVPFDLETEKRSLNRYQSKQNKAASDSEDKENVFQAPVKRQLAAGSKRKGWDKREHSGPR